MKPELDLLDCTTAYDFGVYRGQASGRAEPTDGDFEWIARTTGGLLQCTAPQDAVDFAAGMHDGAEDAEDWLEAVS
jgi:hypothetical protein